MARRFAVPIASGIPGAAPPGAGHTRTRAAACGLRSLVSAAAARFEVHWRLFLQETPQGDLVLATAEGADPTRDLQQIGAGDDAFTQWWAQQIQNVHGVDLRQPPPGPLPELVLEFQAR